MNCKLTLKEKAIHKPSALRYTAGAISFVFSFEVVFTLFLFSGRFKADPRFVWIPVDITGLFFGLSICVAIYLISIQRVKIKRHALFISTIALCFVVWLIVSLAWTPGVFYAREKAFYVATLTFWSLLGAALVIASDVTRIKRFFLAITLFSLWVMLESYFVYFNIGSIGVIRTLGGNYLGVGYTCGIGGLIVLGYVVLDNMILFKKFLMLVLLGSYFFIMLIGGGRGPLLMMIIASMIPVFFAFQFSHLKSIRVKKYLFPFMAIIMMIVVLLGYLFAHNQVYMVTIHRMLVLFEPGSGASGGVRQAMLFDSISFFFNNPLFGYGVGSYPIITGCVDSRIYPHNIFLEIMVEIGLVGLVLFVTLLFVGLRSIGISRIIRNNPICTIIIMIFIFTLGGALISGDLHDNRLLFMVIGLMAFQESTVRNQSKVGSYKAVQITNSKF